MELYTNWKINLRGEGLRVRRINLSREDGSVEKKINGKEITKEELTRHRDSG